MIVKIRFVPYQQRCDLSRVSRVRNASEQRSSPNEKGCDGYSACGALARKDKGQTAERQQDKSKAEPSDSALCQISRRGAPRHPQRPVASFEFRNSQIIFFSPGDDLLWALG